MSKLEYVLLLFAFVGFFNAATSIVSRIISKKLNNKIVDISSYIWLNVDYFDPNNVFSYIFDENRSTKFCSIVTAVFFVYFTVVNFHEITSIDPKKQIEIMNVIPLIAFIILYIIVIYLFVDPIFNRLFSVFSKFRSFYWPLLIFVSFVISLIFVFYSTMGIAFGLGPFLIYDPIQYSEQLSNRFLEFLDSSFTMAALNFYASVTAVIVLPIVMVFDILYSYGLVYFVFKLAKAFFYLLSNHKEGVGIAVSLGFSTLAIYYVLSDATQFRCNCSEVASQNYSADER